MPRPDDLWFYGRQAVALGLRTGRRRLGFDRTVYAHQRGDEYRAIWNGAATLIGASLEDVAPGFWRVRRGRASTLIHLWMLQFNDPVVTALCADKLHTHRIAGKLGIPVPEHAAFPARDLGSIRRYVAGRPGDHVVKPPRDTSSGVGVTTHVRTPAQASRAAVLASLFGEEVLVERMVAGESCRLLYLGRTLLHAVRRRGLRVTGDGMRPVAALAADAGLRSPDPGVELALAAQSLAWDSVPAAGEEILVRSLPPGESRRRELRTTYDEEITSRLHPATVAAGSAMVAELGARIAGIDLITRDPGRPLAEVGGGLIEVNPSPGIHHHYLGEADWQTHPVATRILEHLLEG